MALSDLAALLRRALGDVGASVACEYLATPVWISLGSDCQIATTLRRLNRRAQAFPFDWCVTLGRLSEMFASHFNAWCKILPPKNRGERPANQWGVFFAHDPDTRAPDAAKYARRINRLRSLLALPGSAPNAVPTKNGYEIAHLIRQTHKPAHHGGDPLCSARSDGPDWSGMNTDEIGDAIRLDRWLQQRPASRHTYRIWLVLVCPKCYSSSTIVPKPTSSLGVINLVARDNITSETSNDLINAHVDRFVSNLTSGVTAEPAPSTAISHSPPRILLCESIPDASLRLTRPKNMSVNLGKPSAAEQAAAAAADAKSGTAAAKSAAPCSAALTAAPKSQEGHQKVQDIKTVQAPPASGSNGKGGERVCVLITSTIVPDASKPLSYTSVRSVYSPTDRLAQTVETIQSVRQRLPQAYVLVSDNSKALPASFLADLSKSGANGVVTGHGEDADSIYKALGEAHGTLLGLAHLKAKRDQFDLFIKLSGRYCMNDEFQLDRFRGPKMTFWRDPAQTMVRTVMYAVPASMFDLWSECVGAISRGRSGDGYEVQMYRQVKAHASYVDVLGCGGRVSVDGTWWSG